MLRMIGTLIVSLLSLTACAHIGSEASLQRFTLQVGTQERVYYLKRPKTPIKGVILAFHGGGGDPQKFDFVAADFGEAAQLSGFAVVYPEGLDKQWNDGREEIEHKHDDLAFFDALLPELVSRHQLPAAKVFATGISNGGLFSFRLACERSDKLYAIAPVAAGIGKTLSATCQPKQAVSIIQFFGSKDPVMPFRGGPIHIFFDYKNRGEVLSQEATWELWQKLNHCSGHHEETFRHAMGSDYAVTRDSWNGCPAAVEGDLFVVYGAGHTWPGGSQYLSENLVGNVSHSFLANPEILKFFERRLGN